MTNPNNNLYKIRSFEPVLIKDWILSVSVNALNEGVCIIMFHRYEHILRCTYVIGQDDAAKFIEHIIETYK